MSRFDHPDHKVIRDKVDGSQESARQSRPFRRWHLIAWTVAVIGLAIWLAAGTVQATTYSYNPFTEITLRYVTDESLQHIWAYQAQHLPSVGYQYLLDGAFGVSIVVVVLCVIAGSWLLLVTASGAIPSDARRKWRSSIPKQSP